MGAVQTSKFCRTGSRIILAAMVAAFPIKAGLGQAIDVAPLVAPPVPKVVPPPTPEVLPPILPALPQPEPVPPGPPVRVDDVRVEGATVYDAATLRGYYAGLIGATVPRERLQAAVEALQARYREDGYILTTVGGAADQSGGRLVFVIRVVEGFIGKVSLDGDIGPAGELALSMLQHLTWIRPARNADLERYLLLVNDIPGVSAQAVLRKTSPEPGSVDLVAQVQRKPFGATFQYDNRGSSQVGPHEGLWIGQANSFTQFGEQFEAQFFNTFNREELFGQVGLSGFLNDEGLKGRGYFGRGNTQPGGGLAGTGFNADLQIAGLGLSYPLIRSRRLNLSADGAFDTYDSDLSTFAAGGLASESHLRIFRFGGSLDFQDAYFADLPAANLIVVKVSQGVAGLGASPSNAPLSPRPGNRVDFTKVTGEATRVQNLFAIGDVQTALKASVGGQFTDDILPPSEKYLLGGTRFGRGFFAGQVSGDRALGATAELQFNTGFADALATGRRLDIQFYGFFDYGRSFNLGLKDISHTIDSVGGGARSDVFPWMFVELEGVRRLTTRPTGAATAALADTVFFSRVVLRY